MIFSRHDVPRTHLLTVLVIVEEAVCCGNLLLAEVAQAKVTLHLIELIDDFHDVATAQVLLRILWQNS